MRERKVQDQHFIITMQDRKMGHWKNGALENAGLENAGLENAGLRFYHYNSGPENGALEKRGTVKCRTKIS